jgi:hypothetical protein
MPALYHIYGHNAVRLRHRVLHMTGSMMRALVNTVGNAIRAYDGHIFIADLQERVERMEAGTYPTPGHLIVRK